MNKLLRAQALGLAILIGLSCPAASAPKAAAPPLALIGGNLIDGRGGKPLRDSVILIRNGRIETVGTVETTAIPPGYQHLSTEGMTVMPGLFDLHEHLMYSGHTDLNTWDRTYLPVMESTIMPAIAHQLLMHGITSARDPMAPTDAILHIRDKLARGEIPGPTLYVSGALLEHAGPPGFESFRESVSSPQDGRDKVNALADKGVNLIKLLCVPQMSQDEANAIVDQAHRRGLIVAAHGREDAEIRKCLAAGVDDFQHLKPGALLPDDIMELIRERIKVRPLYWTPTVGNAVNNRYLREDAEMLDDPAWQAYLPKVVVADVRESLKKIPAILSKPSFMLAEDEELYKAKFWQLKNAGVQLLVGADSGNPGNFQTFATWVELDTWVNHFGVDPMEAIVTATGRAAQVLHADKDYGTVEPGKFADIIVVAGDPLRHIDLLRNPLIVIKTGRRYK